MSNVFLEIKEIFTSHSVGKKYAKMTLFLIILAVTYNVFIVPISLVAGGSAGLGVLFKNIFDLSPAFTIFVFDAFCFFVSCLFLEAEDIVASLYAAIVYPIFIQITSFMCLFINIDTAHTFVIVIFAAIIFGFGQGSIFKLGLNIGGVSILSKVIYKYTNISMTLVNAFINGIIVLLGGIFIGFSIVLYAILFLVLCRYISEKVLLGESKNKTFKIISRKHEKIVDFIEKELKHDVTIYDTEGAYNDNSMKLIMSVVPTSHFMILCDYIKAIDKKAFIFITDTYEVRKQDVKLVNESVK